MSTTDQPANDAPALSQDQLAILRHALGEPKHADACTPATVPRNFYFVGVKPPDGTTCDALVALGLLEAHERMFGGRYYAVTAAGFAAVRRTLPRWRPWVVTTSLGSRTVYAASRAKARAQVISSIVDAGSYTWLVAAREISSVRGG